MVSVGGHWQNICQKCNYSCLLTVVPSPATVGPGDYAGHQVQLPDHLEEPSLSHHAACIHILHILQTSELLQDWPQWQQSHVQCEVHQDQHGHQYWLLHPLLCCDEFHDALWFRHLPSSLLQSLCYSLCRVSDPHHYLHLLRPPLLLLLSVFSLIQAANSRPRSKPASQNLPPDGRRNHGSSWKSWGTSKYFYSNEHQWYSGR